MTSPSHGGAPQRPGGKLRPPPRAPDSARLGLPRKAPWIALLSVLVIGAMPFLVCPRLQGARAAGRAEEALGELLACLGEPRDAEQLRGRAITAQLDDGDWPARCGRSAASMEVALTALAQQRPPGCDGSCCEDDEDCNEVAAARRHLADLRAALLSGRFDEDPLARLLEMTERLGFEPEAATASEELPPPSRPPRPADREALARGGYDASALVLADGGQWRLLLHARHKHASLCAVDPEAASASCKSLPPAIPIADTVLLIDGAGDAPLHVLARQSDQVAPEAWGVYAADSGELRVTLEHDPVGVALSPEGHVAAVMRDVDRIYLATDSERPWRLRPPRPAARSLGAPLVFGSWLLWPSDDDTGVTLSAQALTWKEERVTVGPAAAIATLRDWHPPALRLSGCRSDALTAIVGVGEPATERPEAVVALNDGKRWQVSRVTLPTPWFGLSCAGSTAALTSVAEREAVDEDDSTVSGRYAISQQRCTMAGCQSARTVVPLTRWRRASRYLVGSVGDKVALAWRSRLGDVRVAVGDPTNMAEARKRSALEGDGHAGFAWDGRNAELLSRHERALMLVASEAAGDLATHGFLVGADGGVRPLTVAR